MESIDQLLQQLEDDPEVQRVKQRMQAVEGRIKHSVSDETWSVFLEWEALWAEYVTLCAERIYSHR